MNKTDMAALVGKAQAGDRTAFEELYCEFEDKVYFFCKRNVGSEAAAKDVTSETFMAAFERIGTLREGESFVGWLYSIAYHKSMDHLKETGMTEPLDEEISDAVLNEPVMLPEDYAVNAVIREQLKGVIDGLPTELRSAVIMYYYNEMSVAEVAKALGTNPNNAKQKLLKARKIIRKKVEKLIGSGAEFCAVPVGAMMLNSLSDSYAKAAVSGGMVKSMSLGAKIAIGGAIAAAAVAIPFAAGRIGSGGDARDKLPEAEEVMELKDHAQLFTEQLRLRQYDNISFTDDFRLVIPDGSDVGVYDIVYCNDFDNERDALISGMLGEEYDKSKITTAEDPNVIRNVIYEDDKHFVSLSAVGDLAVINRECLNKVLYGTNIQYTDTAIADGSSSKGYTIGDKETTLSEISKSCEERISKFKSLTNYPFDIRPFAFSTQILDDGRTAGMMHCRSYYKGIPVFDLISLKKTYTTDIAEIPIPNCVFMDGADVGQFYSGRCFKEYAEISRTDKLITPVEAIDKISEKLSGQLNLNAEYAELVYFPTCTESVDGSKPEPYSKSTDIIRLTPCWVLYFDTDWWHEVFAVYNCITGTVDFVTNR